eukprot:8124830-Lingulodinium_polyedra.AAC.1
MPSLRVHEVLRSVKAAGAHFVGVLEARTAKQEVRHMAGYFAIVGGCTPAKTHGCELWVTKEPLELDGELHL